MKLVINKQTKVIYFANEQNEDYILSNDNLTIMKDTTPFAIITNFNNSNCEIIETFVNPPLNFNIKQMYLFVNNEFIINPNYRDEDIIIPKTNIFDCSVAQAMEMLLPIPKQTLEQYAYKRADMTLEFWRKLMEFHTDYTFMGTDLQEGILLFNIISGVTKDEHGNIIYLTQQQIFNQNKAKNWYNKLVARYIIDSKVGDIFDLMADNNKQVNVNTGMQVRIYRLLIAVCNHIGFSIPTNIIPNDIKSNYDEFTTSYAYAVENGYKDRSDLEDPVELVTLLMQRNAEIAEIVKTYYLDKLLPEN